jgi:hypothetical protein
MHHSSHYPLQITRGSTSRSAIYTHALARPYPSFALQRPPGGASARDTTTRDAAARLACNKARTAQAAAMVDSPEPQNLYQCRHKLSI